MRFAFRCPSPRPAIYIFPSGTHYEVLPCPVLHLDPLLKATHEAVRWLDAVLDLGQVDLEQQAHPAPKIAASLRLRRSIWGGARLRTALLRACWACRVQIGFADLCDLVTGPPDLDKALLGDLLCVGSRQKALCIGKALLKTRLACCSSPQVRLVLFTLCVREIRAFVDVQRQAESALVRSEVVPQDVWILEGKGQGGQGGQGGESICQHCIPRRMLKRMITATPSPPRPCHTPAARYPLPAHTLLTSIVSSASLRRRSRRSTLASLAPATPAPLFPARFW